MRYVRMAQHIAAPYYTCVTVTTGVYYVWNRKWLCCANLFCDMLATCRHRRVCVHRPHERTYMLYPHPRRL